MNDSFSRRHLIAAVLAASTAAAVPGVAQAQSSSSKSTAATAAPASKRALPATGKPLRIYAITFRGMTEVEKGFEEHFASRKLPVQIIYRDINRDPSRMPALLDEIRTAKPDLIYTWGTTVTLGVVGPHDTPTPEKFISDIPVVFTLVAAPALAKIVAEDGHARPNLTGVVHVAPVPAQIQAMAAYRPFKSLGVLYTPTEQNSVVIVNELRKLGNEKGFTLVERPFKLDANNKPTAEGAADLVRDLKEQKAQWLYLPPDSFLGTLAQDTIIPAAMAQGLPTFASTEQLMQAGALSGLVSKYHSVGQFTAFKAEQILFEKIAPSRIPIEPLKRFSYQVRISAAERLKLMPPLPMFNYAEIITDAPVPQ
jgi:putative tryptophan/tyrosine transport system substrate-binding protein